MYIRKKIFCTITGLFYAASSFAGPLHARTMARAGLLVGKKLVYTACFSTVQSFKPLPKTIQRSCIEESVRSGLAAFAGQKRSSFNSSVALGLAGVGITGGALGYAYGKKRLKPDEGTLDAPVILPDDQEIDTSEGQIMCSQVIGLQEKDAYDREPQKDYEEDSEKKSMPTRYRHLKKTEIAVLAGIGALVVLVPSVINTVGLPPGLSLFADFYTGVRQHIENGG